MTEGRHIYKVDELVLLSQSEYSDFRVIGLFRVLANFSRPDLVKEYLLAFPDEAQEYEGEVDHLVSWLLREKKVLEEVDIGDWHVGSYGTIDRD